MSNKSMSVKNPLEIMKGRRILLVESDAAYRNILTQTLSKVGAFPRVCSTSEDAFASLRNDALEGKALELCLLGLNLEKDHGLSFLKKVRAHKVFRSLKVVLHTLPSKESFQKKAEELKIQDYVERPVTMADLIRHIAIVLKESVCDANQIKEQLQENENTEEVEDLGDGSYPQEFKPLPDSKNYPLRLSWYKCPFDKTVFSAPRLIARALKPAEKDLMVIGLYSEAAEKDYLHYPLIEQISCPHCLYTCEGSGFHQLNVPGKVGSLEIAEKTDAKKWKEVFFTVNTSIEDAMAEQTPARFEVAEKAHKRGRALFEISATHTTFPRSTHDALVANQLALDSYQAISTFTQEEAQARAHQKSAGFLLKRSEILHIAAKQEKNKEKRMGFIKQMRSTQRKALAALEHIAEIELRVLAEQLICLTRRFFLADELASSTKDPDKIEKYRMISKKAFAALKAKLIEQRQRAGRGSKEVTTVERYLAPMEDRMIEIDKEKKAAKK